MNEIKHVSFDVWGTLVTANPTFAFSREHMLTIVTRRSLDEVRAAYRSVKKHTERRAVSNGDGPTDRECIVMLLNTLAVEPIDPIIDLVQFNIQTYFTQHPPTVDYNTMVLVSWLRQQGITVSIASNTNFVSGKLMLPFLEGVLGKFDFALFSDELSCSKPANRFFAKVCEEAWKFGVTPSEILHVGDSIQMDGVGAHLMGLQHAVIKKAADLRTVVESRFLIEE